MGVSAFFFFAVARKLLVRVTVLDEQDDTAIDSVVVTVSTYLNEVTADVRQVSPAFSCWACLYLCK